MVLQAEFPLLIRSGDIVNLISVTHGSNCILVAKYIPSLISVVVELLTEELILFLQLSELLIVVGFQPVGLSVFFKVADLGFQFLDVVPVSVSLLIGCDELGSSIFHLLTALFELLGELTILVTKMIIVIFVFGDVWPCCRNGLFDIGFFQPNLIGSLCCHTMRSIRITSLAPMVVLDGCEA